MTTVDVEFLIIGDDYKADNERTINFTFDAIPDFTLAAVGKMGFDNDEDSLLVEGGTLTDNEDGTWTVSFEIDQADTTGLTPGNYNWSIEISEGGEEVTVGRNDTKVEQIKWVEKYT